MFLFLIPRILKISVKASVVETLFSKIKEAYLNFATLLVNLKREWHRLTEYNFEIFQTSLKPNFLKVL